MSRTVRLRLLFAAERQYCADQLPRQWADDYFLSRHSLQREDSCRNPAWGGKGLVRIGRWVGVPQRGRVAYSGGLKSLPRAVAAMRGPSTGSERQPGQSFAKATAPVHKVAPLCSLLVLSYRFF